MKLANGQVENAPAMHDQGILVTHQEVGRIAGGARVAAVVLKGGSGEAYDGFE